LYKTISQQSRVFITQERPTKGGKLLTLLLIFVSECVLKKVQEYQDRLELQRTRRVLVYTDGINLLRENKDYISLHKSECMYVCMYVLWRVSPMRELLKRGASNQARNRRITSDARNSRKISHASPRSQHRGCGS
jgi:hypothetical protein